MRRFLGVIGMTGVLVMECGSLLPLLEEVKK
jgi:hypothetical protein